MKLSAKDESYFKIKAQPNIPPKALASLSRRFTHTDEWANGDAKIVNFEYLGKDIQITLFHGASKKIAFWMLSFNGIVWSSKHINTINFIKGD